MCYLLKESTLTFIYEKNKMLLLFPYFSLRSLKLFTIPYWNQQHRSSTKALKVPIYHYTEKYFHIGNIYTENQVNKTNIQILLLGTLTLHTYSAVKSHIFKAASKYYMIFISGCVQRTVCNKYGSSSTCNNFGKLCHTPINRVALLPSLLLCGRFREIWYSQK